MKSIAYTRSEFQTVYSFSPIRLQEDLQRTRPSTCSLTMLNWQRKTLKWSRFTFLCCSVVFLSTPYYFIPNMKRNPTTFGSFCFIIYFFLLRPYNRYPHQNRENNGIWKGCFSSVDMTWRWTCIWPWRLTYPVSEQCATAWLLASVTWS